MLERTIEQLKITGEKPSLLLHACCAPCSSYVLELLSDYFKITIFYYNPNIYPDEEYNRRLNELKIFLTKFPPALKNQISLMEENYNQNDFYSSIKIKENPELSKEPEKGERCRRCYYFRMKKAYQYACSNNYDYFTTTLSISPFKDSLKINTIGKDLETDGGTKFLFSDFKKKNGFKRSLELSTDFNLYRQQYCGCIYSQQNKNN